MVPVCVHAPHCYTTGWAPSAAPSMWPTLLVFPLFLLSETPKSSSTAWVGLAEAAGQRGAGKQIVFIPCSGVGGPEVVWIFFQG